jgi:nucleoside-diphosphate-sugar epimerase
VDALRERGHAVACLVRNPRKARHVLGEPAPELVQGDLADTKALTRGCAGADAVVHLAGLTAARSRSEFFEVNAGGTRALAEVVRGAAARLVYVSSLAAAGPVADGVVPNGDDAAHPVSDYGRSKLAGEETVRQLPLAWTILRPPAVYGPRDREFLRLFRAARRGVALVLGDGSQRLSVVFASDLAGAIVRCLEAAPANGIYYPAHPEATTARALVDGISAALEARVRVVRIPRTLIRPILWITGGMARVTGRRTLLSPDKTGEILADAWICSPARLEASTGWRASTSLADGLRRTADWYRAAGWL